MWDIDVCEELESELESLSKEVIRKFFSYINLLETEGPSLSRPYSDTLKGAKYTNLKELRFDADGGVWRFAYAFDPERKGIILIGGDKSGVNQKKFYKKLIKQAEERYEKYLSVS
jgi:hypothetical protein